MPPLIGAGDATVIIPCAGSGQRLDMPHPKELLPLGPGEVLIDHVLALLAPSLPDLNIVVVVDVDKLQTVHYLHRYVPNVSMAFVYQPQSSPGLYGAVRAALPWCGSRVVTLLPDELIEPSQPNTIAALVSALDHHPVAFLAAAESDVDRLGRDGSLNVNSEGRVIAYADQSTPVDAGLNAVWTGFAFHREVALPLLDAMEAAQGTGLLDARALSLSRIAGALTVYVGSVQDMGTWPQVYERMARGRTQKSLAPRSRVGRPNWDRS